MPRKSPKPAPSFALALLRPYLLPALATTFLILAALVLFHRFERFLLTDHRFELRPPELGEALSPDIRLAGLNKVRTAQVRAIFLPDEGQSVYRLPLHQRRQQLLQLRWVKQASVTRLWPSRVDVRILERVPVAFVQLSPSRRGAPSPVQLIDVDGVLLPVSEDQPSRLPVLTGIRESHSLDERAARVRLMLRFLNAIGALAQSIPEIDVAEPDNLKVIYLIDGRAITLVLGSDDWEHRINEFLRHYSKIKERMPGVVKVDLRLPDRITALPKDDSDDSF